MKKIILFFILMWVVDCDAQGWQSCGEGVLGILGGTRVFAMAADTINNILYAGGDFDTINDTTAVGYVAKWNGTTWSSIPAIDSISAAFYNAYGNWYSVNAMIVYHEALYLPASFTYPIGGGQYLTLYYVVEYNGDSIKWLPALDGEVNCFTVYNDTLYIGGDFVEPDTTVFNHVAKWNGTQWQSVGSGFIRYSNAYAATVNTLGVSDGKLYAGGYFDQSGNTTHLFSIAQWNDTAWAALGRGISDLSDTSEAGQVTAIGSFQNNLFIGGGGYAGYDTTNGIAEWDGNNWFSINQQVGVAGVFALQNYYNKIYIGGVGVGPFKNNVRIASWDGTQWDTLGSGVNNAVYALTVFQNNLYVGGQFDSAGDVSANSIARWLPDSTATGEKQITINSKGVIVYPNPFSQQTTLQFSQSTKNNYQLTLYDLTGRAIENYFISSGTKNFILKRNNLPAGMYFYKVMGNDTYLVTGKIVAE